MSDIASLLREAAEYVDANTSSCLRPLLAERLEGAAESLGEPVAWLCVTDDGGLVDAVVTDAGKGIYEQCGRTIQPLYLAPQPAVPDYLRAKKAMELYESEYVGQKHEPLWSWAWLAAAGDSHHE